MGKYSLTNIKGYGNSKMKYIQFSKPGIKLSSEDMKNIQRSINSGWFCNGEYVQELEKHFRDKFNVKYAVSCASCTSGLIIAIKALNIKNGVILLPAFTWPSTEYAVSCNNNIPLWCDVDMESWDANPNLCDNGDLACQHDKSYAFTKWWDCQISVDIFGNESYMRTLRHGHPVPTIYDAAHGYGLENLGNRGDIEVVSLSFTKPITSMQGGMILFNNEKMYEEIRELVNLSAKLTEVNAYVALKSIEQLSNIEDIRNNIRDIYRNHIECKYTEQLVRRNSVHSTFSILLESNKKRNSVAKAFKENNIEVKIYYDPLYRGLQNTEDIYSRIISLPVYEEMMSEIPRICKLINEA